MMYHKTLKNQEFNHRLYKKILYGKCHMVSGKENKKACYLSIRVKSELYLYT